jgi:phosphate transport system substrate-binding protein
MKNKRAHSVSAVIALATLLLAGCDNYFKNDYTDNSPTSGKLKVFYDEGLELHVRNQVFTFESQYHNAHLELFPANNEEAVQALYHDSCESIIITRQLSEPEKKAFASRNYFPKSSAVAVSGVALITNVGTSIDSLSYQQVVDLLSKPYSIKDSAGNMVNIMVLLDKNNSSVVHYLSDSLLKGGKFSAGCNILGSSLESINRVATHKNTVALIDFAWLSDADDSLYKANQGLIKFIAVSPSKGGACEYPHQSSFKLGTYPLARTIYVYRKTGDFSLAKGFESFVASPKGQLTFLKQGLLPARQSERIVKINMGS